MKAVLLLAGMAFILSACSGAKENEGAERTFFAMDTYITLNAYGKMLTLPWIWQKTE